jgi:hypothetical protein
MRKAGEIKCVKVSHQRQTVTSLAPLHTAKLNTNHRVIVTLAGRFMSENIYGVGSGKKCIIAFPP